MARTRSSASKANAKTNAPKVAPKPTKAKGGKKGNKAAVKETTQAPSTVVLPPAPAPEDPIVASLKAQLAAAQAEAAKAKTYADAVNAQRKEAKAARCKAALIVLNGLYRSIKAEAAFSKWRKTAASKAAARKAAEAEAKADAEHRAAKAARKAAKAARQAERKAKAIANWRTAILGVMRMNRVVAAFVAIREAKQATRKALADAWQQASVESCAAAETAAELIGGGEETMKELLEAEIRASKPAPMEETSKPTIETRPTTDSGVIIVDDDEEETGTSGCPCDASRCLCGVNHECGIHITPAQCMYAEPDSPSPVVAPKVIPKRNSSAYDPSCTRCKKFCSTCGVDHDCDYCFGQVDCDEDTGIEVVAKPSKAAAKPIKHITSVEADMRRFAAQVALPAAPRAAPSKGQPGGKNLEAHEPLEVRLQKSPRRALIPASPALDAKFRRDGYTVIPHENGAAEWKDLRVLLKKQLRTRAENMEEPAEKFVYDDSMLTTLCSFTIGEIGVDHEFQSPDAVQSCFSRMETIAAAAFINPTPYMEDAWRLNLLLCMEGIQKRCSVAPDLGPYEPAKGVLFPNGRLTSGNPPTPDVSSVWTASVMFAEMLDILHALCEHCNDERASLVIPTLWTYRYALVELGILNERSASFRSILQCFMDITDADAEEVKAFMLAEIAKTPDEFKKFGSAVVPMFVHPGAIDAVIRVLELPPRPSKTELARQTAAANAAKMIAGVFSGERAPSGCRSLIEHASAKDLVEMCEKFLALEDSDRNGHITHLVVCAFRRMSDEGFRKEVGTPAITQAFLAADFGRVLINTLKGIEKVYASWHSPIQKQVASKVANYRQYIEGLAYAKKLDAEEKKAAAAAKAAAKPKLSPEDRLLTKAVSEAKKADRLSSQKKTSVPGEKRKRDLSTDEIKDNKEKAIRHEIMARVYSLIASSADAMEKDANTLEFYRQQLIAKGELAKDGKLTKEQIEKIRFEKWGSCINTELFRPVNLQQALKRQRVSKKASKEVKSPETISDGDEAAAAAAVVKPKVFGPQGAAAAAVSAVGSAVKTAICNTVSSKLAVVGAVAGLVSHAASAVSGAAAAAAAAPAPMQVEDDLSELDEEEPTYIVEQLPELDSDSDEDAEYFDAEMH